MRQSIQQLLEQVSYPEWIRSNCDDEGEADRRLQNVSELLDWLVFDEERREFYSLESVWSEAPLVARMA